MDGMRRVFNIEGDKFSFRRGRRGEKLAEGVGSGCRLNQAKLLMHGLR